MNKLANLYSSQPLALNTHWLKENLPRYLWDENEIAGTIAQVEILYRGESSQRAVVLYEIELQHSGPEARRPLYVGYVVPRERLAAEHENMAAKAKIRPALGRTVALVPEAEMIVVAFPNDEKLHLLTEAELHRWAAMHLHEIANGVLEGKAWEVQEAKTEILRYVPTKRCTTRCRIKMTTESAPSLSKEISFIAKQLAGAEKARRQYDDLVAMRQAWSGNEKYLPARLPRALAWEASSATVFIEEIPGKNLECVLAEIDLARVIPAVGGMLADFHRARMRVKRNVTRAGELADVQNVIQKIAAAYPNLQPRLQRLFDQLEAVPWDESSTVLLHGTFRLNHIFIHGDDLALIDFDSLRMGQPACDLANFLSSLYYLETQNRLAQPQRHDIVRHFIAGYAAKALVPAEVVLWFLADLLIRKQAYKYLKHFHAEAAQKVEAMLALSEAVLAGCRKTTADADLTALWKLLP
ncbi:aminoglycoside phosphotransferase family protein [candidate division KSB1 bacterium]|nr:MAG: aminoglycoside phosphotransferase family protein [candidate division KSB1 bacterium]MCE7940600.1 aminoglycoside phosphotransferase family protein [Chlorobi bacterium CHB1]MDL1876601.1 aminoglycoside phosphotransferase family protein [Cytophagia bacterium CHB2]